MFQKKKNNPKNYIERKHFVIPQLPKRAIDMYRRKDEYSPTQFVSPIFGKSVMDKTVVLGFKSNGDIRKQYNAFRDEKIPIEGEAEYQEFSSFLVSNKTRQEIFPGAQVIENKEEETKRKEVETSPDFNLSFMKDLTPQKSQDSLNNPYFTEPIYGKVGEEKQSDPQPKVNTNSSIFSYGNDSFSDVPFEKFSFPKYEEPSYSHSRVAGFDNEQSSFNKQPNQNRFESSNVTPVVEEEVTYKEEVSFGKAPSYKEENAFLRNEAFKFNLEEEKIDVYEESIKNDEHEEVVHEKANFIKYDEPKEEYVHKVRMNKYENYHLPPVSLLKSNNADVEEKPEWIQDHIDIINSTLIQFEIDGEVSGFTKGPSVTRYEIKLKPGVHVKKVSNISDNLKMALAAKSIRIEAPIPGKPNVGIEVPNKVRENVYLGNIVNNEEFLNATSPLKVAVGLSIDGKPVYNDIAKMPHGLIAGTTGSGKSVCVNGFLISLLMRNKPNEVKLMLVDPKVVEFSIYNDIPHLVTPVINDPKIAAAGLAWCVEEMERRYKTLSDSRVRNIEAYNEKVNENPGMDRMPYIVVVIDELADLMMVAANDVEDAIKRLTAKSRACGIHLLVATQRPTTDVVKGTIKANIPARFAFRVASIVDSSTIIDTMGAESLLGHGDMLIKENDAPYRLQGAYVSDNEIDNILGFIRNQAGPDYLFDQNDLMQKSEATSAGSGGDELFAIAARYAVESGSASTNRIQKELNVGFNRAQRLMDMLKEHGVVASVANGAKGNMALLSPRELDDMLRNGMK